MLFEGKQIQHKYRAIRLGSKKAFHLFLSGDYGVVYSHYALLLRGSNDLLARKPTAGPVEAIAAADISAI
jgi:hypothetical protein